MTVKAKSEAGKGFWLSRMNKGEVEGSAWEREGAAENGEFGDN
jgi:hypothetical protein